MNAKSKPLESNSKLNLSKKSLIVLKTLSRKFYKKILRLERLTQRYLFPRRALMIIRLNHPQFCAKYALQKINRLHRTGHLVKVILL